MNEIPERGILPVTVPGALQGWTQALKRHGRLSLRDVFEDAIYYAEEGYPVTEVIAGEWRHMESLLLANPNSTRCYLIDGKAPRPGQRFFNKDLARTYKKIVEQGVESFYEGDLCNAIIRYSDRSNGLLSHRDFKDHTTTWVEPISTDYRV